MRKKLEKQAKKLNSLALDRTLLANERTLLAYLRTAFASFLFGLALIKLFENGRANRYTGVGLIVIGIFLFVKGCIDFRSRKEKLQKGIPLY